MFLNTDAVVLKIIPFSETSLICRLFTKDKGKITIMAKGARRNKSPLSSILEPGNLIQINCIIKENRDIQLLKEACFIFNTINIRDNIKKIITLLAVIEVLDKTTQPFNDSPILFRLINKVINKLSITNTKPIILYSFYLLQLTIQYGFKPDIRYCSKCRKKLKKGNYSKTNGELYCSLCSSNAFIVLDSDELKLIQLLMITHINELDKLNSYHKNFFQISVFLEEFMMNHIDGMNNVRSINFLHNIL